MSPSFHQIATWGEIIAAAFTFLSLLFIAAPYGRHHRKGWGPEIDNRAGWVLMELPTLAVFLPIYFDGKQGLDTTPLVLLALWLSHYVHRTLIFPFRLRTKKKRVPLLIVSLGAAFNSLNATVISAQLSHFGDYAPSWLSDPRFLLGLCTFAFGYVINRHSDHVLLKLRAPGETGYKIPTGGLYRFVSCPNYLGEIIQWLGFAIATWSFAGLAFALYTAANVGPRAMSNHKWYRRTFSEYPSDRRALIPKVL